MGTRIHLYAVPGLPLHVDDLMPQSLLARCAGGLAAHGNAPLVIDAGSVDGLEGIETETLRAERADFRAGRHRWRDSLGLQRRRERRALARFGAARVARIVEHLPDGDVPALAVIQIRRRKDVRDARTLGRLLRNRFPQACIAMAGDFVNDYARSLLAGAPEFDVACVGPAESVLAGLARSLADRRAWEHIPGLVFRRGNRLAVGSLGMRPLAPDFAPANYHPSAYPGLLDGGKIRIFTLPHSSGSSHIGHYRGGTAHQPLHVRDARQLRAEMLQLHELYGACAFHIAGTRTPRDAVAHLAAECLSLPFDAVYSRDAHVCEVDTELLVGLAHSGCRAIGFSLLTGSQRLLSDFYGEDWTISQAEAGLRASRASGLYLHTDFVYPCPADDYHSRAETFRVLRRCLPDSAAFSLPELPPGSAWSQHASEFGFRVEPRRHDRWIADPLPLTEPLDAAINLPYALGPLNGATAGMKIREAESELVELGIDCAPGAVSGLMARVAGWETPFPNQLSQALSELDLAVLHDMIESFNARATASINAVDLFAGDAIRKAVGD